MTTWQTLISELESRELVRAIHEPDRIELEHDRADATIDRPYPLPRYLDRRSDGRVVALAACEGRSAVFEPTEIDAIISFFEEVPT